MKQPDLPDECDVCGNDTLTITTKRNPDEQHRDVTVTCNQCKETVMKRNRVNYKSPIKDTDDE